MSSIKYNPEHQNPVFSEFPQRCNYYYFVVVLIGISPGNKNLSPAWRINGESFSKHLKKLKKLMG